MANNSLSKLRQIQAQAQAVLGEETHLAANEHTLTRFQRFLHFCLLVWRSFVRNRCPVRASALAYASLLALVPMLAVIASVYASVLKNEGEEHIQQLVQKVVATITPETTRQGMDAPIDSQTVAQQKEIAKSLNAFIQNIRSGALGTTGMIALVFMAITMLSRIEDTFNDIWGVTRGRSWFARIVQYWAALTLGPIFLTVALALTSGPYFQSVKEIMEQMPWGIGQLVVILFRFLPFFILSITFALFYQLMPNTKVYWRAALIGGIVGGCLWQLNNMFSVLYVSRVVTNSKIYGSLGMIPVIMIGLYLSWMILLFGAQVAYAYQNRRSYLQARQVESLSQSGREFITLRLMTFIGHRFQEGRKAATLLQIADAIGAPSRLVGQLLTNLSQAKIVIETGTADVAYVPARPLDQINCLHLLEAVRNSRSPDLETKDEPSRQHVREQYERIKQAEHELASQLTVATLVAEAYPEGANA